MNAEDREALAEALRAEISGTDAEVAALAVRLLPVVDSIARRRAAGELRAAAADLARPSAGSAYEVWAYGGGDWLRARADALEAE